MINLQNPETTARLELRALEKMIGVLCEHTEKLSDDVRARGKGASRETDFQLQAFDERRMQALEVLSLQTREPCETRIARLEKLVEALDCSRTYFRPHEAGAETSEWSIRLR